MQGNKEAKNNIYGAKLYHDKVSWRYHTEMEFYNMLDHPHCTKVIDTFEDKEKAYVLASEKLSL